MRLRRSITTFVFLLAASGLSAAAEIPSIADKTAGMQRYDGFIPFYWDNATGKIWLEVWRLNEDFIYVNWLSRGLGSNPVGLDRGQLGDTRMVRFERIGPKILLRQPNMRYRALSDDADERRAVEESFAASVLWGGEVAAESDGAVLVDVTDFLMRDAQGVIERFRQSGQGTFQIDKTRSAIVPDRTKAFPLNSEFEAMLTFAGTQPGRRIVETTPTPEAVTLYVHHSFVAAPPPGYVPRKFDPRAGVMGIEFADYASAIDQPLEKRWIRRHRLIKKDPSAAVSEPVKPITYYLDRGAPEPVRSALLEGVRWWNEAYEAAGFRNAFKVELLPEGADPLDVRYNVINWVHRSTRGWSYGGAVADPRTGEVIKAVVTLGSLRVRQDRLLFEGLASQNAVDVALARIRQLGAHEVGHTLGFAHNFAASTYNRGSVMDYPAPLVKITKEGELDLSDAYAVGIGPWDKIAVRYAYTQFPAGADEDAELEKIIDESIDKGYLFISDADSRPLGAPHPLSSLWDNGSDPIAALDHTMRVRAIALDKFGERSLAAGQPMSELALMLAPLYLHHRYQVEATAKTVGGETFSYALNGDKSPKVQIVPAERQRAALASLMKTLSPDALTLPQTLLALLPPPAYGYDPSEEALPSREGRVFDPLASAATAAETTVAALLEPTRAARLEDFHARDKNYPGLDEVIDALLKATWLAPAETDTWRAASRYEAETAALNGLLELADAPRTSPAVRSVAQDRLLQLDQQLTARACAVCMEAAGRIERFLNRSHTPAAQPAVPETPPGSPIGAW